jgi:hypothetical protein
MSLCCVQNRHVSEVVWDGNSADEGAYRNLRWEKLFECSYLEDREDGRG